MKKIHTFVVLAYKESKYLEECIKSVLNQEITSEVIIATTTDNKFIRNIAKKYNLEVIVGKHTNIGGDFDFALKCGKTPLVTIAHQDDVYDPIYSKRIVDAYEKNKDSLIIFSDYYEIKGESKQYSNTNLKIKRILLTPLRIPIIKKSKLGKRLVLRFGNAISCPAVTFNMEYVNLPVFECDMTCNVDWHAWEVLSKSDGKFTFIAKCLMGHRIHEESETTKTIGENKRTIEDLEIYKRFWPTPIAKFLAKIYSKSENNNKVK